MGQVSDVSFPDSLVLFAILKAPNEAGSVLCRVALWDCLGGCQALFFYWVIRVILGSLRKHLFSATHTHDNRSKVRPFPF